MNENGLLLIPVENQVRELDPKLLLACIAAKRGFSSIIGSRREMEMCIDMFPRSIFLSKSMTIRSLLFFRIAHRLGHKIVTWDEEALVHLPADTYYSRRLDPRAIKYVSHLFAWGQDNVDLWRQYPDLPQDTPIHASGNPRGDMLRPDIREFYRSEADGLIKRYGDFILVNTNFNHVNAFGPDLNLFKPVANPGEKAAFGRAARGMSREYAEGLRVHKETVFRAFLDLIPRLEEAFPRHTIVVRPHPTEKHDAYQQIAAQGSRIVVTNEGNVVPWLMATQVVLHNGCTTGVEAYVLGVPAISYRAAKNSDYDDCFYRLPNLISHQCYNYQELRETLDRILSGKLGAADGAERKELIAHYLTGQDGPSACEQMVAVLEEDSARWNLNDKPGLMASLEHRFIGLILKLARWVQPRLPGSHNRPEFQRHRFPGIDMEDLRARIGKFQHILGEKNDLETEQISDKIFRIKGVQANDR